MDLEKFKKKLSVKNEKLIVTVSDPVSSKKIHFSVSNDMTLWRAESLFIKEPITIEWIRSFEKDSIFYDIGANVGMYSVFAASINDIKVYSFEPEANNFQILMENIIINNLIDKIIAYPIGVSNSTMLTTLYLSSFDKGRSHHMVGESLDHNLKKKHSKYKQGIFSTSLNDLTEVWNLPNPHYLKIDVDGIEYKIIEKSDILLKNKELRSVLIEINQGRSEDKKIINTLTSLGFRYDEKQVNDAKRKSGMHKDYAEYLFYRK